tara:strand:+ start:481 stop:732 length:252 start_codon:yes stop_codon:yes gene_type:complete
MNIDITKDSWDAYKRIFTYYGPMEKIRWSLPTDVEYAEDMLKDNNISNLDIRTWKAIDNNRMACREFFDFAKIPAISIKVKEA